MEDTVGEAGLRPSQHSGQQGVPVPGLQGAQGSHLDDGVKEGEIQAQGRCGLGGRWYVGCTDGMAI